MSRYIEWVDVAMISTHLTHEGMPPKVRKLSGGRFRRWGCFCFNV
jgi:hypothetical protein